MRKSRRSCPRADTSRTQDVLVQQHIAHTLQDGEHVHLAAEKARDIDGLALATPARKDAYELDHRAADVGHASLRSVSCEVLARVDEHSVDGKPFVNIFLFECAEVRRRITIGHRRKLHIELVDLMLVRSEHVLRDSSNEVPQEAGHVLHRT